MSEPSTPPSPLAEASVSSLDEFFSRRPPFGEDALSAMVSELRRMREKWESLGEGTKVTKKRATPKAASASSAQLSADDLWSDGGGEALPK